MFLACAACAACAALGACPAPAGQKTSTEPLVVADEGTNGQALLDPRELPPKVDDIAPTESEPEFTYCCGNASYKLEIECEAGLMRCYVYRDEGWHYTYGRHCKKHLGQICYLNGCDDKCE